MIPAWLNDDEDLKRLTQSLLNFWFGHNFSIATPMGRVTPARMQSVAHVNQLAMGKAEFHVDPRLVALARRLQQHGSYTNVAVVAAVLSEAHQHFAENPPQREEVAFWVGTLNTCRRQASSTVIAELLDQEMAYIKSLGKNLG